MLEKKIQQRDGTRVQDLAQRSRSRRVSRRVFVTQNLLPWIEFGNGRDSGGQSKEMLEFDEFLPYPTNKLNQVDRVLYTRPGLRVEGTLHLTAHHIIFKYESHATSKEEEIWVCALYVTGVYSSKSDTGSLSIDLDCRPHAPLPPRPISHCFSESHLRILHSNIYSRSRCI